MLKDIRVLDLADEKGSFCSRLLADLGASVIKVEKPEGNNRLESNNFFHAYHNANKLGITLDLNKKADKKTFLGLVKNADVLVETFQPGYLETTGMGLKTLNKTNPGLVHVAITGFGQRGPGKDYYSCDLVASASGGQMYSMGDPSGQPRAPFGGQSYYAASLFAAIQILLALKKRDETGEGEHFDISLQEAVASTLDHVMVSWFYEKTVAKRQGNLYVNSFFCILPCKDGHIQLTLLQQWETLVELMAAEGMAADLIGTQWQDETYRIEHINHIIEVVGTWAKNHTAEELFMLGQTMRFPWAPVCSLEDVLKSPQLETRQFFMPIDGPCGNVKIACPGLPCKFSSFSQAPIRPAPFFGEHNKGLSNSAVWSQRTTHLVPNNKKPIASSRGILTGVRVLDFTWMLAGPYATRILADSGAEVIKVQSKKTANGAETNTSGYFNTWNRNKRSVTIDLGRPESRNIILDLVKMSDIVVENFSPRVMSNWDLSYSTLKEVKPDLIMASISAMGQTGPWKDFVGYGPTFHALSGLTAMTSAGRESPIGLGHAYADTIIGLYSALAILTALKKRDATGEGQYIDISGYEALCTLLGPALLRASVEKSSSSFENFHHGNTAYAPYGCYRCAGDDRWCAIAVFDEDEWHTFCGLLDNPDWTREKAFSTSSLRIENHAVLDRHIEAWTSLHNPETIVDLLQNNGIAADIVENAEDLLKDSSLAARNFFVELVHPVLGKTFSDRSALNFPAETTQQWKAAPLLGEDNQYVFMELLGFSEGKFLSFIEKGIIS